MLLMVVPLLLALGLAASIVWLAQTPDEQAGFGAAARRNTFTLLALLGIMILPAVLLLPLPPALPRLLIGAAGLGAWGMLVITFWDERVVPRGVIVQRIARPKPGSLPSGNLPADDGPAAAEHSDGDAEREFRWVFQASDALPVPMRFSLQLSTARYQGLRAEPRRPVHDWAHYAARHQPEVNRVAAAFYGLHAGRRWSPLEQASNVLAFTQACIRYGLDADTAPAADWPRYATETLYDGEGDCEDNAILAAAVLLRLGFDVALLYYPGHCALGIAGADDLPGDYAVAPHSGTKYFYGETTAEGWRLGEVPAAYRGRAPERVEPVRQVVVTDRAEG